jgi:hypothetical protein
MSETPLFDLLERDFGPRFDESPWSPELLEIPEPSTLTGLIDMIKRDVYSQFDTQMIPTIGHTCEVAEACPVHGGGGLDEPVDA